MRKKSLKKEQLDLLRFEKELLALGVGVAALTSAGVRAERVVGDVAANHAGNIREAYLNLVETVQAAHDAVESSATLVGAHFLKAGGTPKNTTLLELARSVIGIG